MLVCNERQQEEHGCVWTYICTEKQNKATFWIGIADIPLFSHFSTVFLILCVVL